MHFDAEREVAVHAMTAITDQLGAVGYRPAAPAVKCSAAGAMQAVAGGGEIGDDSFDHDLIAIVAVATQNGCTVTSVMFAHNGLQQFAK
jgi:hypothetical protein